MKSIGSLAMTLLIGSSNLLAQQPGSTPPATTDPRTVTGALRGKTLFGQVEAIDLNRHGGSVNGASREAAT